MDKPKVILRYIINTKTSQKHEPTNINNKKTQFWTETVSKCLLLGSLNSRTLKVLGMGEEGTGR